MLQELFMIYVTNKQLLIHKIYYGINIQLALNTFRH
jgi:hypothetical protein